MRYFIGYLIRGEAGRYNQKLIEEVGPRCNETHMTDKPRPPHITLKSPFETDNIKEVEQILETFVKTQKPAAIDIKGFDHFRKFVAFMKTIFSKEAKQIQKDLLKELSKLEWMQFHEFDLTHKPHATIAYGNTKENFDNIWNELNKYEPPNFNLKFDNITIFKKINNLWKIHKRYEIK